jgi:hypothetical protein
VEPRVHFITLGVTDLAAARRFYVEGLGWEPTWELPGVVVFLQVGPGLLLTLWTAAELDADSGGPGSPTTPAGFALAHNVDSEAEVVAVMTAAEAAGATILKAAQRADFGGFHGYFADPSGARWEVAHNPGWRIGPDGRVVIGPVDA